MAERDVFDCYFCGGKVETEIVDVVRRWKGRIILIENVPAGVCNQCGERYYDGEIAEAMDRIMRTSESELEVRRQISVPVVELKAA